MAIEIKAFKHGEDKKLFETFLRLPRKLYADDPNWTPELLMERREFHDPKKQPLRREMDVTYFLAFEDGKPVGRITAHTYPAHNRFWDDKVGFFGFFETTDNPDVAQALFDAASDRLKALGMDTMRGPANFCSNEEWGSLIWAEREEPACVMMIYNPLYHQALYEGAGFTKGKDLYAYEIIQAYWPNEKIQRVSKLAKRRYEASLRPVKTDKANWRSELDIIKRIYSQSWEKNWGFVPLDDEQLEHMANELRILSYPSYNQFVCVKDEPVGWVLTLPDAHQLLRHTDGKLLKTGWHMFVKKSQFAWNKVVHRVRIAILGVLPEWRKRGLEAMMYEQIFLATIFEDDVPRAEVSWVLEDNAEMINGAKMMRADHYKTYRLYDRPIA